MSSGGLENNPANETTISYRHAGVYNLDIVNGIPGSGRQCENVRTGHVVFCGRADFPGGR
jgi:hypothetical protein